LAGTGSEVGRTGSGFGRIGGKLGGLIGTIDFAKNEPPEMVKLPPFEKVSVENDPPTRVKLPVFVKELDVNEPPTKVKLPLFVKELIVNDPLLIWRVAVLPRVRPAKEPLLPENVTMKLAIGRSITTALEGTGTPRDQFEGTFQLPPCGLIQASTTGCGLKSVLVSSHST
jgi:hypothetical protein